MIDLETNIEDQSSATQAPPLLTQILRRKGLVFAIAFAVTLAGVGIVWLRPAIWEGKSVLLFTSRPSLVLPGGFGASEGLGLSRLGMGSALSMTAEILSSSRMNRLVCEDLRIEPDKLVKMTSLKEQGKSSSLLIRVKNTDREMCRNILKAYTYHLKNIVSELHIPSVQNECNLLNVEINNKRRELNRIEEKIQHFLENSKTAPLVAQSQSGMVLADATKWINAEKTANLKLEQLNEQIRTAKDQVKRFSESSADIPAELPPVKIWRSKLVNLEYKLKLQEITHGPESPEVIALKEQIELTKGQLKSEVDNYLKVSAIDGTESLAQLVVKKAGLEAELEGVRKMAQVAPREAKEFQVLTREAGLLSATIARLVSQYDMARMQESLDPNRWTILDDAIVFGRPINKAYAKTGVMSMVLGLFLGSGISILLYSRDRKRELFRSERYLNKVSSFEESGISS